MISVNVAKAQCNHCHQKWFEFEDKGLTTCPHCRKSAFSAVDLGTNRRITLSINPIDGIVTMGVTHIENPLKGK